MDNLKFKDLILEVLSEIFGDNLKHGYSISKDEDKSLYERLEMNLPLVKPEEKAITDIFKRIKAERIARAEIKRRYKDLMKRDGGLPSFHRIKKNIPNAVKYIKDLLKDRSRDIEAESLISQLEIEHDKLEAEETARRKRKDIPTYEEFLEAFVLAEFKNDTLKMDKIKIKVRDALGL